MVLKDKNVTLTQMVMLDKVLPNHPTLADFLNATAPYQHMRVISFGSVYNFMLQDMPFKFGNDVDQPFRTACKDVLGPPSVVQEFVDGFRKTYLGDDYAALHLRRGDFSNFFGNRKSTVYAPIASVAEFVLNHLSGKGMKLLFVATDASPTEIQLLERLLITRDPARSLVAVRLPQFDKGSEKELSLPWVKDFLQMESTDHGNVRSLVEKLICASAQYFIGTKVSTFTHDIMTLRRMLGTLTDADTCIGSPEAYFCIGHH
eukprot:TRINITY_DN22347_c0_g3_i2.p1 TRINITY_DN22347_c0_g3~~TRINITY_DN22347_c0_g3_i2.p1  ORF type:complete len:260 (-),score=28.22 TRINITY_DN22347_c0_g3_i2:15-794(-)